MSDTQATAPGHVEESKVVPPYVPFRTFKTFIESLRVGIPSRIDRSVMGNMSGATQSQIISALRYLGLISANGLPNDRLAPLVQGEGAEWQKQLRGLLRDKYPFLFRDGFDLTRATTRQFEEAFDATGTSSETAKKCMGFFLAAAKDADLKLSPHIKPYRGPANKPANRVRKLSTAGTQNDNSSNSASKGTGDQDNSEQLTTWAQLLLSKFPNFDPEWSDDVKAKWFDAFDKLMKQGNEKGFS